MVCHDLFWDMTSFEAQTVLFQRTFYCSKIYNFMGQLLLNIWVE
jgi:hypothetical protein